MLLSTVQLAVDATACYKTPPNAFSRRRPRRRIICIQSGRREACDARAFDGYGKICADCYRALLATVACAPWLLAGRAEAVEEKEWMPRRHFRQMKTQREPPTFERVRTSTVKEQQDVLTTVKQSMKAVTDRVSGSDANGFSMRMSSSSSSAVPGTRATLYNRATAAQQSLPSGGRQASGGLSAVGWVAVLFAAAACVAFALRGRIDGWFAKRQQRSGGRWVRDRSLGGKMVWIEDAEGAWQAGRDATRSPLDMPGEEGVGLPGVVQTREGAALTKSKVQASGASRYERPEWWVYQPPLPVSEATRLECKKRAKTILKELEYAKVVQGKDYEVLSLIELFQACKEGGTDVASSVKTAATRDALLRAAVHASLKQAATGSGQLSASVSVRSFVCGLAAALGVPEERTVTIVHAAVAADLRARLLDVAASQRAGRVEQASRSVQSILNVLGVFALRDSAPEAELVGAALRDKFTTSEMESVLKELALKSPAQMALFAVLLGFDKDITLPYLQQYVEEQVQQKSSSSNA